MSRKETIMLMAAALLVATALLAVSAPQDTKLSSKSNLLTTYRVSDVVPVAPRAGGGAR